MRALQSWPDEAAFLIEDVRRRRSDEVDLGATWRTADSSETWRLAWLRETGELYLCRNDSLVGVSSDLSVLLVVADEGALDALLDGWPAARWTEDGLAWLQARLDIAVAA